MITRSVVMNWRTSGVSLGIPGVQQSLCHRPSPAVLAIDAGGEPRSCAVTQGLHLATVEGPTGGTQPRAGLGVFTFTARARDGRVSRRPAQAGEGSTADGLGLSPTNRVGGLPGAVGAIEGTGSSRAGTTDSSRTERSSASMSKRPAT